MKKSAGGPFSLFLHFTKVKKEHPPPTSLKALRKYCAREKSVALVDSSVITAAVAASTATAYGRTDGEVIAYHATTRKTRTSFNGGHMATKTLSTKIITLSALLLAKKLIKRGAFYFLKREL